MSHVKTKIARARRVPCSHTAANTLLGRVCQPLISDWQCAFGEEVNICTVSCSQTLLAMAQSEESCHNHTVCSLKFSACGESGWETAFAKLALLRYPGEEEVHLGQSEARVR